MQETTVADHAEPADEAAPATEQQQLEQSTAEPVADGTTVPAPEPVSSPAAKPQRPSSNDYGQEEWEVMTIPDKWKPMPVLKVSTQNARHRHVLFTACCCLWHMQRTNQNFQAVDLPGPCCQTPEVHTFLSSFMCMTFTYSSAVVSVSTVGLLMHNMIAYSSRAWHVSRGWPALGDTPCSFTT